MSFSSILSTSSSSSSRSNSIERPSMRKLHIELIPNPTIFRETFLGSSVPRLESPLSTPVCEDGSVSPTKSTLTADEMTCLACNALTATPVGRRTTTAPDFKRHAVILPVKHIGPLCRMPTPPTGALPALPSIGENCLMEWERRGDIAIAMNTPTTGLESDAENAKRTDYFGCATASPEIAATPSPPPRTPRSGQMTSLFPSPMTPTRDYRSFLRHI